MICGIDHGFGMIKTRNTLFRTGLNRFSAEPPIVSGDLLYWDGDYYTLSGTRQSVRTDKTVDENYWVLTLMAIAKETIAREIKERSFPVTIAAGLPLGDYSRQVDAFRSYLARTGRRHRFFFNHDTFDIEIEQVKVYPQGYSAILHELAELKKEPVVHIVDIGSWTTDIVTLKNGIPDGDSQMSWENGVIRCFEWISDQVKNQYGIAYRPEQIEAVLWDRPVTLPQNVRDAIRQLARDWSRTFMRMLSEKNIDVPATVTRFIGGGAHILLSFYRDDHLDELAGAKFIDDIAANAIGYETAAALQS